MGDIQEVVIRQIAPHEVSNVWHLVEPGVLWILRKCPDRFTPRDVYWFLRENRASLFLVNEGEGFFVLEMSTEPFKGHRILTIWLMWFLGAKKIKQELLERIKQIGKQYQCTHLQFKSPRRGWAKEAEGFKPVVTTWEMAL